MQSSAASKANIERGNDTDVLFHGDARAILLQSARDAEVDQLQLPGGGQQKVARLEVHVDYACNHMHKL